MRAHQYFTKEVVPVIRPVSQDVQACFYTFKNKFESITDFSRFTIKEVGDGAGSVAAPILQNVRIS